MTVKGLTVNLSGQDAIRITDHELKILPTKIYHFHFFFIKVCSLGPIDDKSSLI